MTERTQLRRCGKPAQRSSEIKLKRRVRGSSATVREGVCLFCDGTPSLTVGLLPCCSQLAAHRAHCLTGTDACNRLSLPSLSSRKSFVHPSAELTCMHLS